MDTTPRKRVLKSVLLDALHRYRKSAHIPNAEFESANADYPEFLRGMADSYDDAPESLHVEEKPGHTGYDVWSASYDFEPENPVIRGEVEAFGTLAARYPARTVLDVGAGTGRHAIPYARTGARVTALEPSRGMISAAEAKARAEDLSIEFHNTEAFGYWEDDRAYDVVLCCLVLSHIEDLDAAMAFLCRHVRPGGLLIVSDFHPFNLLAGMRTSFTSGERKAYVPNFVHLPSRYVGSASRFGLRLVEFKESGWFTAYPGLPATIALVFERE